MLFNSISPGGTFNKNDQKFVAIYGRFLNCEGSLAPRMSLFASVGCLVSGSVQFIEGQNIGVNIRWINETFDPAESTLASLKIRQGLIKVEFNISLFIYLHSVCNNQRSSLHYPEKSQEYSPSSLA